MKMGLALWEKHLSWKQRAQVRERVLQDPDNFPPGEPIDEDQVEALIRKALAEEYEERERIVRERPPERKTIKGGLEHSSVAGVMPRWHCGSCQMSPALGYPTGTCRSQQWVYEALDGAAKLKGFDGSPEAITDVFSALERNCRNSSLYQQRKADAA